MQAILVQSMFGGTVLSTLMKVFKNTNEVEHDMELAEQLVWLVDRLTSWYPEHDLSVIRASDHVCLAYIEACRSHVASPTSRTKKRLMPCGLD